LRILAQNHQLSKQIIALFVNNLASYVVLTFYELIKFGITLQMDAQSVGGDHDTGCVTRGLQV
jgi:hypothetical protein